MQLETYYCHLSSLLDAMLNTLGAEGGRFVARQTEVNQPTLNTVGNITDTIGRKEKYLIINNTWMEGASNSYRR